MKCPRCGSDIADGSKFCSSCGYEIANKSQSSNQNNPQIVYNTAKSSNDVKIPFYLRMWFIILVCTFTSFLFCIPAIVLFIIRIKKFPNNRKGAWIGLAGFASVFIFFTVIAIYFSEYDNRAVDKLIKAGKYDEAIEYVEANYDSPSSAYYNKLAEIYEVQGDYNAAASQLLAYVDSIEDLTDVPNSIVKKLNDYRDRCNGGTLADIDQTLNDIKLAIEANIKSNENSTDGRSVAESLANVESKSGTHDENFDTESLLETRELAEQMYGEESLSDIGDGTVYIDECVVKEFHRIYEKYSPKSGESLFDYFGRAYGDMLDESYSMAQQGDSYDQFAGMHNDIKIGKESAAEKNTYDYNELMNNTMTPSYHEALTGKNKGSLVKLRIQVQAAYENSYVVIQEKNEKYIYDNDAPYIAYFTANPIKVTNISDVESRHLLTKMKSGDQATIIGKIIKNERIDGQEFPIIEIHLARKISAAEDLAISGGYIDYEKKYNVTKGAGGYVEVRTEAGYDKEVEREIQNGIAVEFSGDPIFDENGEPVYDENGKWVYEPTIIDGVEWYSVTVLLRSGYVYGWLPITDIGEDYVY